MPSYWPYYYHMAFKDKEKPLPPMCTSGSIKEKDKHGIEQEIGTPCGRPLVAIPYRRRDEDVKTLNVLICPSCDAYDKWSRENVT